jgi:hypothetical protein
MGRVPFEAILRHALPAFGRLASASALSLAEPHGILASVDRRRGPVRQHPRTSTTTAVSNTETSVLPSPCDPRGRACK